MEILSHPTSTHAAIGVSVLSILFLLRRSKRKDVKGKVVLITGAASGLGKSLAIKFAKLGARVVVWDVNEEGARATAEECQKYGGKEGYSFKVDLCNYEDVYAVADQVKKTVGKVDILINNAGIVTGKKLLDSSEHLINKTFQVNSISLFWTAKSFLPDMIDQDSGHIVTISSMAGCTGVAGLTDYCASKFAAFGFNESLRLELAKIKKYGVKTTVICPYYVNTGMFDGVKSKFFLLPILEQEYVSDKIVDSVLRNKEFLSLPWFTNLLPFMRILPVKYFDSMARFIGVSDTMDTFVGRK